SMGFPLLPRCLSLLRTAFDGDSYSDFEKNSRKRIPGVFSSDKGQKASQSSRPQTRKLQSFFTATCAWGKIPLRLQVWNFCALRKNYARSRVQPFVEKFRRNF
ncbi:hypothetical protein, partial [Vescimonas sp.]|uniref:hypothetical protein n=1 Tax=Vescimonas sp. TaxID=2892404 RepID=UPI00307BCFF2